MERKETPTELPTFTSDIDPITQSKLSETDRLLANSMSITRQQLNHYGSLAIAAYNLSVQNAQKIESSEKTLMGIPVKIFLWMMAALGGALASKVIDLLFK